MTAIFATADSIYPGGLTLAACAKLIPVYLQLARHRTILVLGELPFMQRPGFEKVRCSVNLSFMSDLGKDVFWPGTD